MWLYTVGSCSPGAGMLWHTAVPDGKRALSLFTPGTPTLHVSSPGSCSPIHIHSHAHGHALCTQICSFSRRHTHSLTRALPLSFLSQPQPPFLLKVHHLPFPPVRWIWPCAPKMKGACSYLARNVTTPCEKQIIVITFFFFFSDEPLAGRGWACNMPCEW